MAVKNTCLLMSCLVMGMLSWSAHASPEPTLKSILKTEYDGHWHQLSFSDLAGQSWNTEGTTLTFSLISENADLSNVNSFGIKDDGVHTIFAGSDTTSSASVSHVLQDELSGIFFKTDGKQLNQYKLFVNKNGDYAIAFEDTFKKTDRDYNDMVLTMRVNVAAVPEPETVSMMLAGLGLVGAMVRRKNKKTA